MMFKICVVGCGAMSVSGHGPSFAKYKKDYPNVSLAGCCDLIEEKAKSYQEEFGFEKYYTDYVTMLSEIKPHVVSLISPVHLTKPLSIDMMKRGYSIILEKPPGLNREEIEAMMHQAKESNVSVRTAFNRRYIPLILKLKELLRENDEKILNITYQMYRYNRRDQDFSTTAIHAIDGVKDIIGSDYKKVDFTYQELPEYGEKMTNIYLNCTFENEAVAQIAIVPMGGVVCERITVNTVHHTYFVELPFWGNLDFPGRLRHIKEQVLAEDISGAQLVESDSMFEGSGFYEENRSFFEALRRNQKPFCDLESAIQSVEIADCIRERKQTYERI